MMRTLIRLFITGLPCSAALFLFCSQIDDATNLGSEIINDIDPDKVRIDRHYREFLLDSTALEESYSVPQAGDEGFGVHGVVAGNVMVVGRKSNESAVGFVQFLCTTDSGGSGRLFYTDDDSLISVQLFFPRISKDTSAPDYIVKVCGVAGPRDVFDTACKPIDTLTFDDSLLVDTVTIPPGDLRDSIFQSCRSLDTKYDGDTFSFTLVNIAQDTLYRFPLSAGIPGLKVTVFRSNEENKDSVFSKSYPFTQAFYYVDEDERDSLQGQAVSSYASSRTAVYRYRAAALWNSINDTASGSINKLISAGFMIRHPKNDTHQLQVKYLVASEPLRDGVVIDSLFKSRFVSDINDSSALYADVREELQRYARMSAPPSSLYLHLRLDCNRSSALQAASKEQWQTAKWDAIPYLKSILFIP
ncbi:MAG: hypothetical protein JW768_13795 [Chitinispirillaceae bacterium]|nr:hypothetical protein [Chitinispirillaceae bacterium]